MHFLSDPKYLKYKGFEVCDIAKPGFELLYMPFEADAQQPKFKACAKSGTIDQKGIVIYYSNGCPHTDKYVPIVEKVLIDQKVPYEIIRLTSVEAAQRCPAPCTNYALFIDGHFITSEVLTEKKILKYLETR